MGRVNVGRQPTSGDSYLRGLLGPPQARFSDTTERDAYATANPTWLAAYDADDNRYITVGGQLQHRAVSAWADATEVVQGGRGPRGIQGDTGPAGATFPAGQAQFAVLVAQSAVLRAWQLLEDLNFSVALRSRIVPAPETANAGYAVVSSGTGLVYRPSAHIDGGVSEARVEALIAAHRQLIDAHHPPVSSLPASALTAVPTRWGSFTQELEDKLAGIQAQAQRNVQADWAAGSGDALILNKPTIYLPSDAIPLAEFGTGSAGMAQRLSRADHIHPLRAVQWAQLMGVPARVGTFTAALEARLLGIEAGAEVNVQADWDATTGDAAILNKPATFGGVTVSGTAPASPTTGDLWFDTTAAALKVYNGTAFANVGGSGAGLSQSQVQALINAHRDLATAHHVAVTWANLPGKPTIPTLPPFWQGQSDLVNETRLFSPNQILDQIARQVQNWAQAGNSEDIPLSKIPTITRAQLSATLQGYVDHAFVSISRSGAEIRFAQNDGTHEGLDFGTIAAAAAAATGNDRLAFSSLRGAGAADIRTLLGLPAPTTATARYLREDNTWAAFTLPLATTEAAGAVELATDAEALAAASGQRAVTPANLAALRPDADPLPPARVPVRGSSGRYSDELHVHPLGSAPPVVASHSRRLGISADNAFVASEFTVSSTSDALTFPAAVSPAHVYIAFAVPNDTGDLTAITPRGGFNEFVEFERVPGTLTIGGTAYKVWRSSTTWIAAALQNTTWDLQQGAA